MIVGDSVADVCQSSTLANDFRDVDDKRDARDLDPMNSMDTAPMTRRERKKQETRRRIRDAAFSLMKEHGYENVKIEEIARQADVANATFFLHFPNKAALVTAFNEEISEKITLRLAEFDFPPIEQLELLRAIIIDEWRENADLLRHIVSDALAQGNEDFDGSAASLVEIAEDIMLRGQKDGAFSKDFDAEIVAHCLLACWRSSTLQWAITGDVERARRANRQALDLILSGLLPR
ncbi:MAG: TetR/AcrR family transcriptional regulator [Pseudomonadota bacterium]